MRVVDKKEERFEKYTSRSYDERTCHSNNRTSKLKKFRLSEMSRVEHVIFIFSSFVLFLIPLIFLLLRKME